MLKLLNSESSRIPSCTLCHYHAAITCYPHPHDSQALKYPQEIILRVYIVYFLVHIYRNPLVTIFTATVYKQCVKTESVASRYYTEEKIIRCQTCWVCTRSLWLKKWPALRSDSWLNPQWILWFFPSFLEPEYTVGHVPWKCDWRGWKVMI